MNNQRSPTQSSPNAEGRDRSSLSYQSIDNPIQVDRIRIDSPMEIETAAPKRSGAFAIRALIFFWAFPLVLALYYGLGIAQARSFDSIIILFEAIFFGVSILLLMPSKSQASMNYEIEDKSSISQSH